MQNENTVPVLEKAISMVSLLGIAENGATQAEIMKQTGMSGATCYRTIQTMMGHDWIKKSSSGHYTLSYGLMHACEKLFHNIECFKLMAEPLDRLTRKTDLSAKLSVRKGFAEYVTMLRAEAQTPIAITGKIGAVFSLPEGSGAGVLLSRSSDDEIERLIKLSPDNIPEKTNPEVVFRRINECKKKGYCFSGPLNRWGIEVISAPVISRTGDVFAAISLLGFPADFNGRAEKLASEILKTAHDCERILRDMTSSGDKRVKKENHASKK